MPKVTAAIDVAAAAFLDLTDPAVGGVLPVPSTELLAEGWRAVAGAGREATAQAFGRAAFHAGLTGLIVPSNARAA